MGNEKLNEFIDVNLDDLNWVSKKNNYIRIPGECLKLSIVNNSSRSERLNRAIALAMPTGLAKKIAPNDYITFAIYKNRILFKQATPSTGYKIVSNSKSKSRVTTKVVLPESELANYIPFVGYFEVHYDKFWDVYYIEKEGE